VILVDVGKAYSVGVVHFLERQQFLCIDVCAIETDESGSLISESKPLGVGWVDHGVQCELD